MGKQELFREDRALPYEIVPMANKFPTAVHRLEKTGLKITWSDGSISEYSSEILRKNCPCATCKEARGDTSHEKPLGGRKMSLRIVESTRDEELALKKVWAVGNYALGLEWGDGHATGIYTFPYLIDLKREE